ncbi:hypothetical protein Acr_02g0013300 [Actinidia rufa]|uniref:Uncharacterized protein n=1 Tax=Actinidia rufa TaxID=165716 RepID=A0A7J0E9L4_9ERIC|nr:hypothetical protein Acr_02g0013300 [Actinidia rufa]
MAVVSGVAPEGCDEDVAGGGDFGAAIGGLGVLPGMSVRPLLTAEVAAVDGGGFGSGSWGMRWCVGAAMHVRGGGRWWMCLPFFVWRWLQWCVGVLPGMSVRPLLIAEVSAADISGVVPGGCDGVWVLPGMLVEEGVGGLRPLIIAEVASAGGSGFGGGSWGLRCCVGAGRHMLLLQVVVVLRVAFGGCDGLWVLPGGSWEEGDGNISSHAATESVPTNSGAVLDQFYPSRNPSPGGHLSYQLQGLYSRTSGPKLTNCNHKIPKPRNPQANQSRDLAYPWPYWLRWWLKITEGDEQVASLVWGSSLITLLFISGQLGNQKMESAAALSRSSFS